MMKISIVGGGSWGTAICYLLSKKYRPTFYIRDKNVVSEFKNSFENKKYLPGTIIKNANFTDDIKDIKNSDVVVLATPTSSSRETILNIREFLNEDTILVNLSKGFEEESHLRISELTNSLVTNPFVALSGPSHAEEVGKDIPTAVVVSSNDEEAMKKVQDIFASQVFRVYTNSDLLGVEIGGALKNIIALAAGMSDGLSFGDNTKAALMTRGMYEMSKLGLKLGANPHTFNGLSGMGDLIVTCTSMHSRNRRCGFLIGKGVSIDDAIKEVGQVVEGIKTTKVAYLLSKEHNVEMPIVKKLYKVLYEGLDPRVAVKSLMTREKKIEIEEVFFE